MVDEGLIAPSQAESHPERNVITRAVGSGELPDADVWLFPITGEQHFLICSDGLTKELSDEMIDEVMHTASGDPGVAALRLVGDALEAGARDNVTAVVVASVLEGTSIASGDNSILSSLLETTLPREDRR
jgi:serine/threonine protein phosphatase PrpC